MIKSFVRTHIEQEKGEGFTSLEGLKERDGGGVGQLWGPGAKERRQ